MPRNQLTIAAARFTTFAMLVGLGAQTPTDVAQVRPDAAVAARGDALLDGLRPRFVANQGQWASPERYRVRAGGLPIFLEDRGWSFWLRQPGAATVPAGARPVPAAIDAAGERALALRMTFAGAGAPELVAEQQLPGATNFLQGDAARHRRGVPGYGAVRYVAVYPGVDVRARTDGGQFEYDLLLEPGADLDQVELEVAGCERLRLAADGGLEIDTALGVVRQPLPRTWVIGQDGARRVVECRYELRGPSTFGFVAPGRAAGEALVVDPPIQYSTMYGGNDYEYVYAIIEDAAGRILVSGNTSSQNWPMTPGVVQTAHAGAVGGNDGFMLLLDPTLGPGNDVVFATYFGGSANERVASAAFLPSGLIAFAGDSLSPNLPTTPGALQTASAGGRDGYVGLITPDGQIIVCLTYVGGAADDFVFSLMPMPSGDLLVCGRTLSTNYPVTPNAFQPNHRGGSFGNDAHITIVDQACTTVVYATYLGGTGDDSISCSGVDANGLATFHGVSSSTDFPVTATAFQSTSKGGLVSSLWGSWECVVAQFDPSLPAANQLAYSTYLGGSGHEFPGWSVALPGGDLVVAGTTVSPDLQVTPGSYQPAYAGGTLLNSNTTAGDAFAVRLDPTQAGAAGIVWGTYFGSGNADQGLDCRVDSAGEVTLVGWTQAAGNPFPTTPDALRRNYTLNEGWVARLSAAGSQLLYSTLLGGSNHDGAWYVTRHADAEPTVSGATVSFDFPVVGSSRTFQGQYDTFVTRLDLLPLGLSRYGPSTPFAGRHPTIHGLGDATPGNAGFGFACSRAPAGGVGALVIGVQSAPGTPFFNAALNVDLNAPFGSQLVFADGSGEHVMPVTFPPTPMTGFYVQYVWLEVAASLTLSASDGLQL